MLVTDSRFPREVALRVEIDLAESGHFHSLGTVSATCGHLRPLAWNSLGRPFAATCGHSVGTVWSGLCGHLRPLAWNSLERPLALAATCGHLRPLAATCGHSLGTVWSSHLRPLAATRLGLSGAATCGHLRPKMSGTATCSHLRPLAWDSLKRPLAAICGHKWLQVAAMHLLERPLAPTCSSGHVQPNDKWLQVATNGCKRLWVAACCMLVDIHGRTGILKKIGFVGKAVFSSLQVG